MRWMSGLMCGVLVATAWVVPAEEVCPSLDGRWPFGSILRVVVDGDTAFFHVFYDLVIADVSDPANPVTLSVLAHDELGLGVAIRDDLAYVSLGDGDLRVVDISDRANPVELGRGVWPSQGGGDVVVAGDHAFVADHYDDLVVFDISDPSQPGVVGQYGWPTGASGAVAVFGSHALIGRSYDGLHVLDVSDPTDPSPVTSLDIGSVEDIVVAGSLAYVAGSYGLHVIDLSDPTDPVSIGSVDLYGAKGVQLMGSFALVADTLPGLHVIDVDPPTAPGVLTTLPLDGQPYGVAVRGDHALVACSDDGLRAVDLSSPGTPVEVGAWLTGRSAGAVEVSEGLAFVTTWDRPSVVDIGDPERPLWIGELPTSTLGEWISAGPVGDRRVATVIDAADNFLVFDVTDPAAVTEIGQMAMGGNAISATVVDDHALVVGTNLSTSLGLRVIALSGPSAPQQVDALSNVGHTFSVTAVDGMAYIGRVDGLQLVDISTVTSPVAMGFVPMGDFAYDVASDGHHAFVAASTEGLRVVDVSDPAAPVEIASIPTPSGESWSVELFGTVLFELRSDGVVHVIDVQAPAEPVEIGTISRNREIAHLAVRGTDLWLTSGSDGLSRFDLRCSELFADGFETGDQSAWSAPR